MYGTVLYGTVRYCTLRYCTVRYCTVRYCTVQATNTSLTIFSSHLLLPPFGFRTLASIRFFSNTLNQCSSPSVEDKVSHPHQTAGKPETWNITYNRNHTVLNGYIHGSMERAWPEYGTKRHRKETRQHLITSVDLQYYACTQCGRLKYPIKFVHGSTSVTL